MLRQGLEPASIGASSQGRQRFEKENVLLLQLGSQGRAASHRPTGLASLSLGVAAKRLLFYSGLIRAADQSWMQIHVFEALSRMQYLRNKRPAHCQHVCTEDAGESFLCLGRHARAGRPNLSGPAVLRQSSAEDGTLVFKEYSCRLVVVRQESGDALIPPMWRAERLGTENLETGA